MRAFGLGFSSSVPRDLNGVGCEMSEALVSKGLTLLLAPVKGEHRRSRAQEGPRVGFRASEVGDLRFSFTGTVPSNRS